MKTVNSYVNLRRHERRVALRIAYDPAGRGLCTTVSQPHGLRCLRALHTDKEASFLPLRISLLKKPLLKMALLFIGVPALVAATPESNLDIFIGTVGVENGQVILARCDLGNSRYILRDQLAGKVVANLAPKLAAMKAPVYAEVIAAVAQEKDDYILVVDSLQNLKSGKTCHLMDLLPK